MINLPICLRELLDKKRNDICQLQVQNMWRLGGLTILTTIGAASTIHFILNGEYNWAGLNGVTLSINLHQVVDELKLCKELFEYKNDIFGEFQRRREKKRYFVKHK